jgi:hypothetical protein
MKKTTIQDLSITIQALKVDGKKMTIAVFKQLPPAKILKQDGTINTDITILGHVKHEIKGIARLWVVGVYQDVLVRCIHPRETYSPGAEKRNDTSKEIIQYQQNVEASIQELQQYPQLFIAV